MTDLTVLHTLRLMDRDRTTSTDTDRVGTTYAPPTRHALRRSMLGTKAPHFGACGPRRLTRDAAVVVKSH